MNHEDIEIFQLIALVMIADCWILADWILRRVRRGRR